MSLVKASSASYYSQGRVITEVMFHNTCERIPEVFVMKSYLPLRILPPEDEPDDNQHEDHYDQRDAGDYTGPDVH